MPTPASQLLDHAAEILDRPYAWKRHTWESTQHGVKCYCLDGALRRAAFGNARQGSTYGEENAVTYQRAYDEVALEVGMDPIAWNDRQKDKRKVIRVLRRTATRLRKFGQ